VYTAGRGLRRNPDPLLLGRMSERHGAWLRSRYRPQAYDGAVVFLRATGAAGRTPAPELSDGWRDAAPNVVYIDVPGDHAGPDSILAQPHVSVLAHALQAALDRTGLPVAGAL
jgi:thioesterase domain-containing protein